MAKVNDLIKKAEAEIGNTKRRVLLVEGEDDRQAIEAFLNKKNSQWANHWIVFPSGKKSNVLDILQSRTDWLGLVDRDEWTNSTIFNAQQTMPNLQVLPRFCIDNYLINPSELWSALPTKQQQKFTAGYTQFEQSIMVLFSDWLVHGVLWSVINPMWEGLRTLGFKESLLDVQAANDRLLIESKLQEWHDYLEPSEILNMFDMRLKFAQNRSTYEQFAIWIHGKKFYQEVIDDVLNQSLGQLNSKLRKKKIFEHLPVPDDLDFLWAAMGL